MALPIECRFLETLRLDNLGELGFDEFRVLACELIELIHAIFYNVISIFEFESHLDTAHQDLERKKLEIVLRGFKNDLTPNRISIGRQHFSPPGEGIQVIGFFINVNHHSWASKSVLRFGGGTSIK